MVLRLTEQLEMLGLEETRRRVRGEGATQRERRRLERRVEVTHELMSVLPTPDDLSFLHSGLCQQHGGCKTTGPSAYDHYFSSIALDHVSESISREGELCFDIEAIG